MKFMVSSTIFTFLCIYISFVTSNLTESSGTTEATRGILDYLDPGPRPNFCPCQCGKANVAAGSRARFISGYVVSDHEYPWVVIINIEGGDTAWGTLVNDRYVITTASELQGLTPSQIKVTIGGYDRCFPDTIASNQSVNAVIIHPAYDPLTRGNDLGLLRLTNVLTINRFVQPICLPKPEMDYHNSVTQIIGWPRTDKNSYSCRYRRIGLAVLAKYECLQLAGKRYSADKTCIGTGGPSSLICENDVGLGASHLAPDGYYELLGVISELNKCGGGVGGGDIGGDSVDPVAVALFTRLNLHFGWLFENTKDSCYCSKI